MADTENPRTVRSVRALLASDPEQLARFEAELADTPVGGIDDLVFQWWGFHTLAGDPQVLADLHAAGAGTLRTHTAAEVFGPGAEGR
ncbi:hypothetical protein [Streptomyces uncialis]|uniref:hypothetical protein n=1 Tax=Streptomyces uncialis TaxID=1048205 RepID=UPI003787DE92